MSCKELHIHIAHLEILGFHRVLPTNTGILHVHVLLRGKFGVTVHFFRNKASIWGKKPHKAVHFTFFILNNCPLKCNFLFGFQYPLLRSAFPA